MTGDRALSPGDIVQITDDRGRHHTLVLQPGADQRVQRRKGFVQQENVRPQEKNPGQVQALGHAPGKGRGRFFGKGGQLHGL